MGDLKSLQMDNAINLGSLEEAIGGTTDIGTLMKQMEEVNKLDEQTADGDGKSPLQVGKQLSQITLGNANKSKKDA